MRKIGDVREDVPMDVADGIDDIQYSLGCLAEAVKCVSVAVSSPAEDGTDYIEGTMYVLLQAVRTASDEATVLATSIKIEEED